MYIYSTKTLEGGKTVTSGGERCSKWTPIYINKRPTPPLSIRRINERKNKGLDTEQIYGHGSQRGLMPGVSVPAVAGSKLLLLLPISEDAPHQQTRNCLTGTKILSWTPNGCLTPGQTDRLTVDRNLIWTWVVVVESVESYSCEKWENSIWGRWQFGKPEEGECLPLEAAAKQRVVKTKKTLCAVVTSNFGVCNSVTVS
jgi:hypothetical protein